MNNKNESKGIYCLELFVFHLTTFHKHKNVIFFTLYCDIEILGGKNQRKIDFES